MQQITQDGVYLISLDDYHNKTKLFDGYSISSSGLKIIADKSLAHYWSQSPYNPNREPKKKKEFDFGSAAHSLLFGDEHFYDRYAIEPFRDGYNKNETWGTATEKKAWKAEQEKAKKIVVKKDQLLQIQAMHERLAAKYIVREQKIFEGEIEKSLIWKDHETGIWLKARPDVIPLDDTLADYKTCADASPKRLWWNVLDFGYYMQLALMAEGMEKVLGRDIKHFALVFQEKTPPYAVQSAEIDIDYIADGRVRNRAAIRAFAQAVHDNYWPDYPDEPIQIGHDPKLRTEITEGQEAGTMPTYAEAGAKAYDGD